MANNTIHIKQLNKNSTAVLYISWQVERLKGETSVREQAKCGIVAQIKTLAQCVVDAAQNDIGREENADRGGGELGVICRV